MYIDSYIFAFQPEHLISQASAKQSWMRASPAPPHLPVFPTPLTHTGCNQIHRRSTLHLHPASVNKKPPYVLIYQVSPVTTSIWHRVLKWRRWNVAPFRSPVLPHARFLSPDFPALFFRSLVSRMFVRAYLIALILMLKHSDWYHAKRR